MEAYTDFAYVYDVFMDNTPYDKWGGLLVSRLEKEGITDGILLDLGCGTGNMTEFLSEKGYDMIGVDYSGEMLIVAMERGRVPEGRFCICSRICVSLSFTGPCGPWCVSVTA